jgi:hypothetical protein
VVEAGDKSHLDRVAPCYEDDRNRGGRRLGGERRRVTTGCENHGYRTASQVGRQRGQLGTPEENKAAVQGNLSAFGTYTISPDGSLTLQIVGSSFPNWDGTTQKRMVEISGDQMRYYTPATSMGGSAVNILSRVAREYR